LGGGQKKGYKLYDKGRIKELIVIAKMYPIWTILGNFVPDFGQFLKELKLLLPSNLHLVLLRLFIKIPAILYLAFNQF